MILALYIARRFAGAAAAAILAALFLAVVFDVLELARRVRPEMDIGFGGLVGLSALRAPSFALKAAPFVILLAGMWTYARLARSSELVVARAAGVSPWGLTTPLLATAALLGVAMTTLFNPISAAMLDRFERLEARIFRDDDRRIAVSADGLWLRQGNFSSQIVIKALDSNSDGTELGRVTIYLFEGGSEWVGRIDAASAELRPGHWRLEEAVIRRAEWLDDPERAGEFELGRQRAFYDLPTDLTAAQIVESTADPETIDFWRLPSFIENLEARGFSAHRHRLHWHLSLAAPLFFAAMALVGASFALRSTRFGGLGVMALYATLTGFAVFVVAQVAQALGSTGVAPPLVAAWGPPLAAMLVAAGLLLQFEDG